MTSIPVPIPSRTASTGLPAFCALACATTWILAAPAAVAWIQHRAPPPYAIACAGLSAFGPLLAALAVAGRRRELRQVFGRWRVRPLLVVLALAAPFLVHTIARALFAAIGGHPARWLDAPVGPEAIAALVVFPLGEEFGWRGFAHPRMVQRLGPVRGPLALGAVWGLWHLMYAVTPATAGFDAVEFATVMLELPLYSLLVAWVFERANRSLAVAIAFHAGAHLDHIERAPRTDPRLHILHFAVLAVLAAAAAWSLSRSGARKVA
jgi:membrane protease YdiL (CAAX protease family)